MLPRLCIPVPHLRRPQPVQKASDRPPKPPEEALAGKPEDFKDVTNAEWRLAMQAKMRVKVCVEVNLTSSPAQWAHWGFDTIVLKASECLAAAVFACPDAFWCICYMTIASFRMPLAHVQLTALDSIIRTMYRQCRMPHALAEVVDPLPIETLAYGAPSAAVVRVMLSICAAMLKRLITHRLSLTQVTCQRSTQQSGYWWLQKIDLARHPIVDA
jgi:hypothetical protein